VAAFLSRGEKTLEFAAAISSQAKEHGLPYYAAIARIMRGRALAMQKEEERGIERIRKGVASCLAIGTKQQHGYFLALLAEVLIQAGRTSEAIETVDEAMEEEQRNEPFYLAEIHRLKGEALLKSEPGQSSEADFSFQSAIKVARQQQAKSFELRAATSLARLWQVQGRREAAREMLAEIYGWFTEGFDTRDLVEARTLLDDLSS
jgi:predicted ATPase